MIESYSSHYDLVEALQKPKVIAKVGKHYDYHNAMFALIDDITQAATHSSFDHALTNYLLQPLHMTHTTSTFQGLMLSHNRATPHTKNKNGALVPCEEYSQSYYNVAPAGGVNSSARDMATFLRAQMGGFPNVVDRRAQLEMQTPYINTNNLIASSRASNPRYGLGWRIVDYSGETLVYHGGWLKGFTNFLAFMPDQQVGIVILHNADTKFTTKTAMKFFEVALGLPETAEAESEDNKTKKVKKGKKAKKAKKINKKLKSKKKSKNQIA